MLIGPCCCCCRRATAAETFAVAFDAVDVLRLVLAVFPLPENELEEDVEAEAEAEVEVEVEVEGILPVTLAVLPFTFGFVLRSAFVTKFISYE